VYLEQVRWIFPGQLVGRDDELTELAVFCSKPDSGPYAWWQGPAWAGKSALMAWFVLHPPPGVRVVSFFITSRYAGQSDRSAFLEAVLTQLAEVAGQPMPDLLTDSNRLGWFGQLLDDAARACEQDGQRLVLLVDGLDEDRGMTSGPGAHSIAALLPAVPPNSVRVIVSGRPSPPVPRDVPQHHPLRDKEIVRPLSVAPQAQMIRDDAELELDYLLDHDGLERRLLGLVTVSGGGLSGDDLAELTGQSPQGIERAMRSVTGRTFESRDPRWRAAPARVFVMAHEELQQTAARSLTPNEVAQLRDQFHSWMSQYRDQGWPAETPEYLLSGYHGMLLAAGESEQMTALCTDRARLNRILDSSGGDAAGLAEITAVQEFICGQHSPDLIAMLKLAITHDWLTQRNSNIPDNLPVAWARIGNPTRAEALACSIADPARQTRALTAVAEVLVKAGDLDRTRKLARQAETVARSITDPEGRTVAMAAVADLLAQTGDIDRARALARSLDDPTHQAWVLAAMAKALAQRGDLDHAEAVACSITEPGQQAVALAAMAEALAQRGDLDRAEAVACSITEPEQQAVALAAAANALAQEGDLDRAGQLARQAQAAARSSADRHEHAWPLAAVAAALARSGDFEQAEAITNSIGHSRSQGWALKAVAVALGQAGDLDRAKTAARSIADRDLQALALTTVAETLVKAGDLDQASVFAHMAEATASSITYSGERAEAQLAVAAVLVKVGELDQASQLTRQAEAAAHSITDPKKRTQTLAAIAEALPETTDFDLADQIARQAEIAARSIQDPERQARALTAAAEALARAGDVDRAEALARSGSDPSRQAEALAGVAAALTEVGDLNRAEALANSITDPTWQVWALADVPEALAKAGDLDRAEALANSITDPTWQVWALAGVAAALTKAGDPDRASLFVRQAETIARSITSSFWRAEALKAVAVALTQAGNLNDAEILAQSIPEEDKQSRALALVAAAFIKAGDLDRASQLVRQAVTAARSTFPFERGWALSGVAGALAEVGDVDQAENVARSFTKPDAQAEALVTIATVLTQAGDLGRAGQLARQAETTARSIASPHEQAKWLAGVAAVLAETGDLEQAEAVARSINHPSGQAEALAAVAAALAQATNRDVVDDFEQSERSRQLLAQALSLTRDYVALLPAIVQVEPIAVIEAARNIPLHTTAPSHTYLQDRKEARQLSSSAVPSSLALGSGRPSVAPRVALCRRVLAGRSSCGLRSCPRPRQAGCVGPPHSGIGTGLRTRPAWSREGILTPKWGLRPYLNLGCVECFYGLAV
jgi:tetratricopeptide (TPR) repeat protein